jgi:hypothetical protein
VGVALFKDHPNALFPFSEMDKDQRYYVEQMVQSCLRQYDISSPLCKTNNHVVMQMGGGCILYTEPQYQQGSLKKVVRLKPRDVFEALCDCIFASERQVFIHQCVKFQAFTCFGAGMAMPRCGTLSAASSCSE